MHDGLREVVKHFHLEGTLKEINPLAQGHINDTYIVTSKAKGRIVRHVLQRINHEVFKNPPAMMDNIVRITEHIRNKLQTKQPELASRQLNVIRSGDGSGYWTDPEGNYWRIYDFVEGAITYDTMDSPELAGEAARMFGWFQQMLDDLPGPVLHESIPDFHNTPLRFKQFQEVLDEDPCDRAKDAGREIGFLLENADICNVLMDLVKKGDLPYRIAHNDSKINNVMFDERTHQGVCVIDLDTVMPCLSGYDFGDLVRTAASSAEEDEPDVSKVNLNIPIFTALAKGFAKETGRFLTPIEKEYLTFAAKSITFEQFIRFLTDYLGGDVYYKIHRPNHNLDRSRTQMKLVQSMIEHEAVMNEIVQKAFEQAGRQ
ncbi:MAG: aminoglycoside phosphotransferase family protein [Sedimentisphaerales bacterium]|nr:aminoglycoside phosphotransferase family protein [Sedimentisphaerales bacterium]